jgi:hypothetical protein
MVSENKESGQSSAVITQLSQRPQATRVKNVTMPIGIRNGVLSEAFYEAREMPVLDRSGGICTCEKGWNDFSKSRKLSCRKTTACIS